MTSGALNGQITAYTFNSRNQLTAVGTSGYTYDAEGNRIAVNLNGTQYTDVINPNAALSQLLVRTGAESQTFYVYGLGLIGEQNGNDYKVYHYDLRGSTVLLTDLSGATTDSYQYGPYGELLNHTGSSNTQFLYNGRDGVMTDGNGLYYMRARYYSPEMQRFVSRDSLEGSIAEPQSLNRYIFVNGKPISFIDPSGKVSKQVASDIIRDNAKYIIEAGEHYGVNPAIMAGCIFTEQVKNVNVGDSADGYLAFYGILDTSIGIGQVKMSTAELLEDKGYVTKATASEGGLEVPFIGFVNGMKLWLEKSV